MLGDSRILGVGRGAPEQVVNIVRLHGAGLTGVEVCLVQQRWVHAGPVRARSCPPDRRGLRGLHRVLNHFKATPGKQVVKFKLQARKTSVELYVADREHFEPVQLEYPVADRDLPGAG